VILITAATITVDLGHADVYTATLMLQRLARIDVLASLHFSVRTIRQSTFYAIVGRWQCPWTHKTQSQASLLPTLSGNNPVSALCSRLSPRLDGTQRSHITSYQEKKTGMDEFSCHQQQQQQQQPW
jgi:hypothetical protein